MGHAKEALLEREERGWTADDKFVCAKCVEDDHLKKLVRKNATHNGCDYCGRKAKACAAPLEIVVEAVYETLTYFFADPAGAGVPRDDGEWLFEAKSTQEALDDIGLEGHVDLVNDVVGAISNDAWVAAAGGHWASSHEHEVLADSWSNFVEVVKHQSRFFFQVATKGSTSGPQEIEPGHFLQAVESILKSCRLLKHVPPRTSLFRVRERHVGDDWKPNQETMGAPPTERARAGRMNPPGISYFYAALDRATAISEVVRGPPSMLAVAGFRTRRQVNVIDLTDLPVRPSIFDSGKRDLRESVLFLEGFVESISRPVRKDGQEHLDYVPSQVVSEYFALAMKHLKGKAIDGLIYPSAVRQSGKNLVLFPTDRSPNVEFDQVDFVDAEELELGDWKALSAAVS
nr:hypothetical protein [uncultured bacterium]